MITTTVLKISKSICSQNPHERYKVKPVQDSNSRPIDGQSTLYFYFLSYPSTDRATRKVVRYSTKKNLILIESNFHCLFQKEVRHIMDSCVPFPLNVNMHENKIFIRVNLLANASMIISDMKDTVFMFTMISFNKQCKCLNDVCLHSH